MTCPRCGQRLQAARVPLYHYKQCGLSNVYIKETVVAHTCRCGHRFVEITMIERLQDAIAYDLIKKKSLLSGPEFRFLRKWIGLTVPNLMPLLGVKSRVTVSKWENEMSRSPRPPTIPCG